MLFQLLWNYKLQRYTNKNRLLYSEHCILRVNIIKETMKIIIDHYGIDNNEEKSLVFMHFRVYLTQRNWCYIL